MLISKVTKFVSDGMQIRVFCLLVVVAQGWSAIIEASWLCIYFPQQFLGKNRQSSIVYRFICLPQLCCELNLE